MLHGGLSAMSLALTCHLPGVLEMVVVRWQHVRPLQELMRQVSWNLCPTRTNFDSACYYSDDVVFSTLSGAVHVEIDDAPDGEWELQVKDSQMPANLHLLS